MSPDGDACFTSTEVDVIIGFTRDRDQSNIFPTKLRKNQQLFQVRRTYSINGECFVSYCNSCVIFHKIVRTLLPLTWGLQLPLSRRRDGAIE